MLDSLFGWLPWVMLCIGFLAGIWTGYRLGYSDGYSEGKYVGKGSTNVW